MLEFLSLGIIPLWLQTAGVFDPSLSPGLALSPTLTLEPVDPTASSRLTQFIQQYDQPGFSSADQGLWFQSKTQLLGHHQGDRPLPAASLTKVATTLAALKTWDPQHQFALQLATPETRLEPQQTSTPLIDLLRHLNVESDNDLADHLVEQMGGLSVMLARVRAAVTVPDAEIQLQNGSGLGVDNRLSPRAVVALFQAVEQHLQGHGLTLADVFPVAGQDLGTLEDRQIPAGAIVKTGSLWNVSALAGVLPTQAHGQVWFASINGGDNLIGFRRDQDALLQALQQQWGRTVLQTDATSVDASSQNPANQP